MYLFYLTVSVPYEVDGAIHVKTMPGLSDFSVCVSASFPLNKTVTKYQYKQFLWIKIITEFEEFLLPKDQSIQN